MTSLFRCMSRLVVWGALGIGRLLYRLEISGIENLPLTGPCIVLGDHASRMDFILVSFMARIRPDIHFLGGWRRPGPPALFRRAGIGAIPVFTDQHRSTWSLWWALKVLEQGACIGMAPEGGIRWDGRLQPLKPGAAWLALRSRAPAVVCVLRGGYTIWPRWARFPRLTGRMQIRIAKPFSLAGPSDTRVDAKMIEAANRRIADELRRAEGDGAATEPFAPAHRARE